MGVRIQHPESELEAQAMLEKLGCSQPATAAIIGRLLPITLLLISVAAVALAIWAGPYLSERKLHVDLGHLLAALGLVAVVVQWRATIERQSMEKYEAEIAASNKLVSQSTEIVHQMMSHHYPTLSGETDPNYARCTYVYLALDNLEFALERYMCGLSSAYAAARAVMTFENRCESFAFRSRAQILLRAASYSPVVHIVVVRVIDRF